MAAAAAAAEPTDFAPYCPLGEHCSKGHHRLGWFKSRAEAKEKAIHHLLHSEYHRDQMDEEKAEALWQEKGSMDVWPDAQQANKRQKTSRAQADDVHARLMSQPPAEPSVRQHRTATRSLTDGTGCHQYRDRAQEELREQQLATSAAETENTLAWVSGTITRATEHISKSIQAVRTASRMARQAAEAFEAEAHTLQTALDTIQQIYAPGN